MAASEVHETEPAPVREHRGPAHVEPERHDLEGWRRWTPTAAWDRLPEWGQGVVGTSLVFLASRAAVLMTLAVATFIEIPQVTVKGALQVWDAAWYMGVIDHGYPHTPPPGIGPQAQATIAFFPGFPMLARGVRLVTGLSTLQAAVLTSVLCGLAAVIAVWFLVRRISGPRTAFRASAALCFFPASMAFLLPFAEGLAIAASALCLLFLLDRRWVLAGLAGAVATATRPTAMVLVPCCLWAALAAIRRDRDWRSLAAAVLTPAGIFGYFAFLRWHTGNFLSWVDVETRGWGHGNDYGRTTIEAFRRVSTNPVGDVQAIVAVTATVFAVVAVVAVLWWRPPVVVSLYAVGIAFLGSTTGYASRPRYMMSAFPLVVAFAVLARKASTFAAVIGVYGTLLGAYTLLSVLPTGAIF